MTTRGLVLQLTLVKTDTWSAKRRAVLECRYENNFIGPIALSLSAPVIKASSHVVDTGSKLYPLSATGPRLSVVSLSEVSKSTETVSVAEKGALYNE